MVKNNNFHNEAKAVSIEQFIRRQMTDIVDFYYKSSYATRRMIKYLKIKFDGGPKYGWTSNQMNNDEFYIYGNLPSGNIVDNLKKLSTEKAKVLKKLVDDIDVYELDKYLNIYDRCRESGNRFPNYIISKINPGIRYSDLIKRYYVAANDIDWVNLTNKKEIIKRYNQHINENEIEK